MTEGSETRPTHPDATPAGVTAKAGSGSAGDVDVIILSFNRVVDTKEAIASALGQTGVDVRVWVLDQGSEPSELAELEAFCEGKDRLVLHKVEQNLGVAGGRNYLTGLGSAPYVVGLDNDAEFLDERMLERAVTHMRQNPDIGALGFKIINFFTRDNDALSWGYPKTDLNDWQKEFFTTRYIGAGHCLVRSAIEKVGEYDERLFFALEEIDLCGRLINQGLKVKYYPEVAIYHKVSPEKRVEWGGGRYYFHVRNRLYIYLKYGTSWPAFTVLGLAYVLKGVLNGVAPQAVKGMRESISMYRAFLREDPYRPYYALTDEAQDYIRRYDTGIRGGLLGRLRREVFARLPGQEPTAQKANSSD